jgi:hypothetical protein
MTHRAGYRLPERRPLQVFAFDPMLGRTAGNRITIAVRNESLLPGPQGSRVQVIDYDGVTRALYEPVDLDDPAVLMNDGLDPSESDPRFHQQMVYAVAMKVVENFEEALGRSLTFKDRRRLRLHPHAFEGANAFYDPAQVAVLFGYFRADAKQPGPNLPGQTVFTCLSHDVIAHEVTHAIVDRLRPLFIEESNRDVFAFHEAFADVVAIFQHFSFRSILADTIQRTRGDLRARNVLGQLAQQFGYATGSGGALREALERDTPDPRLYETVTEPHERGSILVAAVFDAFFSVYQDRIQDLVRIATGGTGRLPEGDLHPDLVNRIAGEAAKTARNVLGMCIRAFEYLPPVDVSFGDYLRALITADYETVPDDERGLRAAMIEAFRLRGIRLEGVASLAEESVLLESREADGLRLPFQPSNEALAVSAQAFDRGPHRRTSVGEPEEANRREGEWAARLREFARANAGALGLVPTLDIRVRGFHTVFRISPAGQLVVELVAQFTQEDRRDRDDPAFGGVRVLAGSTVIASAEGQVRYVVNKGLSAERRERQREFVSLCDREDPMLAWGGDEYEPKRMKARTFARLHRGIRR